MAPRPPVLTQAELRRQGTARQERMAARTAKLEAERQAKIEAERRRRQAEAKAAAKERSALEERRRKKQDAERRSRDAAEQQRKRERELERERRAEAEQNADDRPRPQSAYDRGEDGDTRGIRTVMGVTPRTRDRTIPNVELEDVRRQHERDAQPWEEPGSTRFGTLAPGEPVPVPQGLDDRFWNTYKGESAFSEYSPDAFRNVLAKESDKEYHDALTRYYAARAEEQAVGSLMYQLYSSVPLGFSEDEFFPAYATLTRLKAAVDENGMPTTVEEQYTVPILGYNEYGQPEYGPEGKKAPYLQWAYGKPMDPIEDAAFDRYAKGLDPKTVDPRMYGAQTSAQEAGGYFTGRDQYLTEGQALAELYAMSDEELAATKLQMQQLVLGYDAEAAGPLTTRNINDYTIEAYLEMVGYAQRNDQHWQAYANQQIAAGANVNALYDSGGGPGSGSGSVDTVRLTNPDDLRAIANQVAVQRIGRWLSNDELVPGAGDRLPAGVLRQRRHRRRAALRRDGGQHVHRPDPHRGRRRLQGRFGPRYVPRDDRRMR
jgi:hypothetical protein